MAYERLVPGTSEWDLYYANHHSRYLFALSQLKNNNCNKVLDAATGVGYGANFLSINGIKEIVAIDRSEDAIEIANKKFNIAGIHFIEDDCENFLNCRSSFPFDAVVSFETLEHLPHPGLFLKNCSDSLEHEGLLIISTPNKLVSSPEGIKDWKYHEKEFAPDELFQLLSDAGFKDIKMYGQQYTAIGKFRKQVRAELNTLNFNPVIKLGRWIQKTFRGVRFKTVLPERIEDFEIVEYPDMKKISDQGIDGPFVLVAVCKKTF